MMPNGKRVSLAEPRFPPTPTSSLFEPYKIEAAREDGRVDMCTILGIAVSLDHRGRSNYAVAEVL